MCIFMLLKITENNYFQSMKSPVELNSLFSKFFCYINWFVLINWLDATVDDLQTRPLWFKITNCIEHQGLLFYLGPGYCLHEISFRVKWNIFIPVSGQYPITVYMIQPEMKLIVSVISLRSFWQKSNFISGDKISWKH